VWTGARARGLGPERIAAWLSSNPARLARLDDRKGRLAAGFDADIVVWDPESSFRVDPARLEHRHAVTPYDGRELFGQVRATYVSGQLAFERV
jgi:allantoinase